MLADLYIYHISQLFPFHTAKQVLDQFRDQFIEDMDANSVVMELLHEGIIHEGDRREISKVHNPQEQNAILHLYLKKKCTNIALKTVCDLVIRVDGNPKMTALGKAMKERLEAGKWCVCMCVCACIRTCVCVCVCGVCVCVCVCTCVRGMV